MAAAGPMTRLCARASLVRPVTSRLCAGRIVCFSSTAARETPELVQMRRCLRMDPRQRSIFVAPSVPSRGFAQGPTTASGASAHPAHHQQQEASFEEELPKSEMPEDEDLSALFSCLDVDGNGEISFDEFALFAEYCGVIQPGSPRRAVVEAELRYIFELADTDGSGKLSMSEVGTLLRSLGLSHGGRNLGATASTAELDPNHAGIRGWARRAWTDSMEFCRGFMHGLRLLRRQTTLAWRLVRGVGPLSAEGRALVRKASYDLARLLPFLLVNLLPGASAWSLLLMKFCPSAVPSAFARAQRARAASVLPKGSKVEEFDRLCLRTFGAFVEEARSKRASRRIGREQA
eukprot:gnl/TRDRNA2_/TRDRNA2_125169_c0_seq1.p1 gnl/TRDRNA2_/TRDRNA2_125169_c0~~gnl/TRDRNA2_/TRDRNA2_125169_c0_seq1.p1  ORF type:complete len:357 (-),score=45.77 gnl/TRDRNA2_/TRDRNA2_125169_c0_seq1:203-1243(-)